MATDGQEERRYQRDRERYQFLMGILETFEQKVPGAREGKPNLFFQTPIPLRCLKPCTRTRHPRRCAKRTIF